MTRDAHDRGLLKPARSFLFQGSPDKNQAVNRSRIGIIKNRVLSVPYGQNQSAITKETDSIQFKTGNG